MHLSQLLQGVELKNALREEEDVEVTGLSHDTRTLKPGEVFVALRGYKTDGHLYIDEARRSGTSAIVGSEGEGVLLTEDSRKALAVMSANWFGHPGSELTLVGVTGTNGKTTVTTLLWGMLTQALDTKVGLIGTNRVLVGEEEFPAGRTTPESYDLQYWLRRMADEGCTHVVMEVSSHALCLNRVDGLRFAVGAFTNLTQDHLDFHKTMEAYREAKERLFSQCETAVLNVDDRAGRYYLEKISCPALTYSAKERGEPEGEDPERAVEPEAGLTAENIQLFPDRVEFTAKGWGEAEHVTLSIPGGFTVSNALCALCCGHALGIPLSAAAAALDKAPGVKGRMEVVPTQGPGTVVIDYAHTPDALENALKALREFTKGRLICLFGCGGDRDRAKRPLMGVAAAEGCDVCVVTSDNPRSERPEAIIHDILAGMARYDTAAIVEPDREKAIALALSLLKDGDVLLLAGKGHETYQESAGEFRHMDEREIVAKYDGAC